MVVRQRNDLEVFMHSKKVIFSALIASVLLAGCGNSNQSVESNEAPNALHESADEMLQEETGPVITEFPTSMTELEKGLSVVSYEKGYLFDKFLESGASSDSDVMEFLIKNLPGLLSNAVFGSSPFGCSTISASGTDGSRYFGRNFDWNTCEALIVHTTPEGGYESVSTVNMDFVGSVGRLPDAAKTLVAIYAPLDGMNEKGLCVSINMIQDNASIAQNTGKTGITTTTAVRLLLDYAADTVEALELLRQYDLYASMGMMVHFAISDQEGNSVVVEYIDDEMVVTETPVVTNFYLSEGDKYGIGTKQSHDRYDLLMGLLEEKVSFTAEDVRDALDAVSKDNFGGFESTEWSIVYNQTTGQVQYYHRENYEEGWTFALTGGRE